ncbi:uncharacterized protein LOC124112871 [Haliotis rufescens]|uniref:uncharacterized protein LOC124112871 n=1 Tax=Haliotis rufescens TaxID=6454 RepID=UPI00201FA1F8|nr:uncharacterized protein LOC124112871 [Haliotis rufescens]
MAVWEYIQFFLIITLCFSSGFQLCDILTFLRHVSLDGLMFSDTFITEHSGTDKTTCLSRCFHELQCNMVLYNPTSQGCRLYYSCPITGGEKEAGWQYYAVPCTEFRVLNAVSMLVRNQSHVDVTCPSGFSYLPTTSDTCFHDNVPVNVGRCMQTLWVDQVREFRTPLPAPLSNGSEIIVEVAADGVETRNGVTLTAHGDSTLVMGFFVRWDAGDIAYNTRTSGAWSTELNHSPVPFTPNVISNLSIKVTDNQFLISLDDNSLLAAPIRIPPDEAVALLVDFSLIKRVQIKYP